MPLGVPTQTLTVGEWLTNELQVQEQQAEVRRLRSQQVEGQLAEVCRLQMQRVEEQLVEELGQVVKEMIWLRRSHENLRKEVAAGLSMVWEVENALAQTAVDMGELLRLHQDEMDVSDRMQLFIRWEGHTVMLGVGAHQSVFSVKGQLLDLLGVPVDQQQLLNAGRQMEDGHSPSYYGIMEGSTVQLEYACRQVCNSHLRPPV